MTTTRQTLQASSQAVFSLWISIASAGELDGMLGSRKSLGVAEVIESGRGRTYALESRGKQKPG